MLYPACTIQQKLCLLLLALGRLRVLLLRLVSKLLLGVVDPEMGNRLEYSDPNVMVDAGPESSRARNSHQLQKTTSAHGVGKPRTATPTLPVGTCSFPGR